MRYTIDLLLVFFLVYFGVGLIASGELLWLLLGTIEIMLAGSLLTASVLAGAEAEERKDS